MSYRIGTTYENMLTLDALEITIPDAEPPASEEEELIDGTVRSVGLPFCTWHWNHISFAEWTVLKSYCPNTSADVYIRTLAKGNGFDTYACKMKMPQNETMTVKGVSDFTVSFYRMVLVSPDCLDDDE